MMFLGSRKIIHTNRHCLGDEAYFKPGDGGDTRAVPATTANEMVILERSIVTSREQNDKFLIEIRKLEEDNKKVKEQFKLSNDKLRSTEAENLSLKEELEALKQELLTQNRKRRKIDKLSTVSGIFNFGRNKQVGISSENIENGGFDVDNQLQKTDQINDSGMEQLRSDAALKETDLERQIQNLKDLLEFYKLKVDQLQDVTNEAILSQKTSQDKLRDYEYIMNRCATCSETLALDKQEFISQHTQFDFGGVRDELMDPLASCWPPEDALGCKRVRSSNNSSRENNNRRGILSKIRAFSQKTSATENQSSTWDEDFDMQGPPKSMYEEFQYPMGYDFWGSGFTDKSSQTNKARFAPFENKKKQTTTASTTSGGWRQRRTSKVLTQRRRGNANKNLNKSAKALNVVSPDNSSKKLGEDMLEVDASATVDTGCVGKLAQILPWRQTSKLSVTSSKDEKMEDSMARLQLLEGNEEATRTDQGAAPVELVICPSKKINRSE